MFSDLSTTYPDLQNVTYIEKDQATYRVDLLNAFASGEAPDLFVLTEDEAYTQKSRTSAIPSADLSASLFDNTFIEGARPFVDFDGTIALPILADPLVMYWNKDLLAAAGFSQPPQYWDEMLEFAQRITKKSESGTLQLSALPFGSFTNVNHAKELLTLLILQANGSVTTQDSTGRLVSALLSGGRSSTAVAAAPSALRFYTDFADPSKPVYTWNRTFPLSQRAFTSGTLALYFGRASELSALRAANPNLNFAMASMPQIRDATGTGGVVATGGVVYGVAIPKTAKNPAGAKVIQWLLASRQVSSALSNVLAIPSARRDVLSEQGKVADTNMIASQAIIIRSWTDPDPEKTDTIFRAMIEDMTSGTILLSESIMRADQQINATIDD